MERGRRNVSARAFISDGVRERFERQPSGLGLAGYAT